MTDKLCIKKLNNERTMLAKQKISRNRQKLMNTSETSSVTNERKNVRWIKKMEGLVTLKTAVKSTLAKITRMKSKRSENRHTLQLSRISWNNEIRMFIPNWIIMTTGCAKRVRMRNTHAHTVRHTQKDTQKSNPSWKSYNVVESSEKCNDEVSSVIFCCTDIIISTVIMKI